MNKLHIFILIACFVVGVPKTHACPDEYHLAAKICKIKQLPNGTKVSRLKTVQDIHDAQEYLAAYPETSSDNTKREVAEYAEILKKRKEQLIKTAAECQAKEWVALIPATTQEAPAIIAAIERIKIQKQEEQKIAEGVALLAALWLATGGR